MKLYTRRGDDGQTDLYAGGRIAKDSPRMDAIGSVDELNAAVGLALSAGLGEPTRAILVQLQRRLFDCGADLATPLDKADKVARITTGDVTEAEQAIDTLSDRVEPMRYFVLPGGSEGAARLHVARCIARRAERLCVALSRSEPVNPSLLIYLNRVSDLLFAAARAVNHDQGVDDVPWQARPVR